MKRIAVVATVYRYLSHAQHIGDRFLVGYPKDGTWHKPDMKVVSLYVDQKPEGDQSEDAREGVRIPGLSDDRRGAALRRRQAGRRCRADHRRARRVSAQRKGPGAVSALRVLQAVRRGVREGRRVGSGLQRQAPVVQLRKAKWMVDASKRLKFPMLAGSSLPVTWRLPDIELPLNCEIESALMVGVRRLGPDGLPRPRSDAMHDRAAQGRRDRRQGRADDRRRRGVEGGRRRAVVQGAADVGAVAQRHAAGTDDRRRPHAGSGGQAANCRSW